MTKLRGNGFGGDLLWEVHIREGTNCDGSRKLKAGDPLKKLSESYEKRLSQPAITVNNP
jgi:hypothetical protein